MTKTSVQKIAIIAITYYSLSVFYYSICFLGKQIHTFEVHIRLRISFITYK